MKPTLVLIDIQNDYFPGGKMELIGMEEAAVNVEELISIFRKNKWPVVYIQHVAAKPDASFFIPETFGSEIHESIRPLENETVIVKNFPNSFRNTKLGEYLNSHQLNDLVICGAMSHMCIDSTVRAASDLGYSCIVISDACATRNLTFQEITVNAVDVQTAFMTALNGTFAKVITNREYIETLLQ